MRNKHYTPEQIAFIRKIAEGKSIKEITAIFNQTFNENRTPRSVGSVMHRNGIKNNMQGYGTRFEKGHETWNKGKKGLQLGGEKGWFREGNTHRRLPIGSERVEEDGFVVMKIANPDVWVPKHRYIWEQAHGQIPKNHVIMFKDNNKENVKLNNLFLASHEAMTSVVRRKIDTDHEEIRPTVFKLAELELKIKELSK